MGNPYVNDRGFSWTSELGIVKGNFPPKGDVSHGEKRKPLTRNQEWQGEPQGGQGEAVDPTIIHSELREAGYER